MLTCFAMLLFSLADVAGAMENMFLHLTQTSAAQNNDVSLLWL